MLSQRWALAVEFKMIWFCRLLYVFCFYGRSGLWGRDPQLEVSTLYHYSAQQWFIFPFGKGMILHYSRIFFFPGRNHSASFPFWQMPKDKTSRRIGHLSELLLVAYLLWYVSLSGMQMDLIMVIITPLYASWWQLRMSCLNVLWRKLEFRSSFWKGRRKKNESSVVCRKCLMFC